MQHEIKCMCIYAERGGSTLLHKVLLPVLDPAGLVINQLNPSSNHIEVKLQTKELE